jgi:DNA helicase-2/ATP-dependent DNA helicase PcrA
MQKIYTTGAGAIATEQDWGNITKPENFRCPTSVLSVVNSIRAEDDGLVQIRGRTVQHDGAQVPVAGTANLFIYQADNQRTQRIAEVRQWLANTNADPLWNQNEESADVSALVLVHRMAARRLGFPNVYAALNDNGSHALKDGLIDGAAWIVRPFIESLLPLVTFTRAGDAFSVVAKLRSDCPLLAAERLAAANVTDVLAQLQRDVDRLANMLAFDSTIIFSRSMSVLTHSWTIPVTPQ